jgi:hypothetical protein
MKNMNKKIVFKKENKVMSVVFKYIKEFILLVSFVLGVLLSILLMKGGCCCGCSLVWFLMFYVLLGLIVFYNIYVNIQNRKFPKRAKTLESSLSLIAIVLLVSNIFMAITLRGKGYEQIDLMFLNGHFVVVVAILLILLLRQYLSRIKKVKRKKGGLGRLTKVSKILSGSIIGTVICLFALVMNTSLAMFAGQTQQIDIWSVFDWTDAILPIGLAIIVGLVVFWYAEKKDIIDITEKIEPY